MGYASVRSLINSTVPAQALHIILKHHYICSKKQQMFKMWMSSWTRSPCQHFNIVFFSLAWVPIIVFYFMSLAISPHTCNWISKWSLKNWWNEAGPFQGQERRFCFQIPCFTSSSYPQEIKKMKRVFLWLSGGCFEAMSWSIIGALPALWADNNCENAA